MKSIRILIITLFITLLLVSCRGGAGDADQTLEGNQTLTQAYATINANLTQQPTQTATETLTPTMTETPTLAEPSATPTQAAATTAAATTAAPVTVDACNIAGFVQDVTIPDGTEMAPGTEFIKTWRLQNDGTCTWNTSYQVVPASDEQMGGPDALNLTEEVAPGETIDISLELVAPDEAGEYTSSWLLRSDAGVTFGIGSAGGTFYVQIEVTGDAAPTDTPEGSETEEAGTATLEPTATTGDTPTETPTPLVIVTEEVIPTETP